MFGMALVMHNGAEMVIVNHGSDGEKEVVASKGAAMSSFNGDGEGWQWLHMMITVGEIG